MAKLTIEDLQTVKERVNKENLFRSAQKQAEEKRYSLDSTGSFRAHILVCGGTACQATKSEAIYHALMQELNAKGLTNEIKVVETGCNGFCAAGPIMVIYPGGIFYQRVTAEDVSEIITEHMIKGTPLERLMYCEPVTGKIIPHMQDIPFFGRK